MIFLFTRGGYTVDGSEIWRSPVEVGSLSHYLQGFSIIPSGCLGFLNHQQYPIDSDCLAVWGGRFGCSSRSRGMQIDPLCLSQHEKRTKGCPGETSWAEQKKASWVKKISQTWAVQLYPPDLTLKNYDEGIGWLNIMDAQRCFCSFYSQHLFFCFSSTMS